MAKRIDDSQKTKILNDSDDDKDTDGKSVVSNDTDDDGKSFVSYDTDDGEEHSGSDCVLSLEKLSLGPKKKLLVIDIGGFLVHRVFNRYNSCIALNRRPDSVSGNFSVFKRPFCEEFLRFCFERFEVGIWSAAKSYNIEMSLDTIMIGLRSKLSFILDQEDCSDFGLTSMEKKTKPVFFKQLKKIWENNGARIALLDGRFSPSNTLMIDHSPCVAVLNPPNTAIFPKEYTASLVNDKFLAPGGELQKYLEAVAEADDVPSYVKEHPFGEPAITPSHPDWEHYKTIHALYGYKVNEGK